MKPPDSEQEEAVPEEVLPEDIIRPSGESLSAEARREVRGYDNVRLPTPNAEVEAARRAWEAGQKQRDEEAAKRTVPQRIYLGTRAAGLWKTSNAGASWVTTTDNLPYPQKTSAEIEAIAVHPNNSDVILAGTGTSATQGFANTPLTESIGFLRSAGRGQTWSQIGPTWCSSSDPAACYVGSYRTAEGAAAVSSTRRTGRSRRHRSGQLPLARPNPRRMVMTQENAALVRASADRKAVRSRAPVICSRLRLADLKARQPMASRLMNVKIPADLALD